MIQLVRQLVRRLAINIATLGPIGTSVPAPGTFGSLTALIAGYFILSAGWFLLAAATLIALIVGVWASNISEAQSGKKDASEVIIDEVAGQWITLLFVPASLVWVIAAFIAFRLFDILRPGPVKLAEQLKDGTGVMADDVVAALLAGMVLLALQVAVALNGTTI